MMQVHIGDVSGGSQVAVGNYIVQIGRVEGGVVNILNDAPPPPRIRPQPVLLRPKIFPGLLDRQAETTTLIDALKSQQSVECTGEPGAGRTSLLRHLAHQSQFATVFPAGVVYFQVNQQSAPDLLKSLFDSFYICDFPIKPTETEMRHYLQSVNALVLLDDVEIDAQQIEYLMNIAPNCTFVAVTRARNLSSDVTEVPVKGLPTADAVLLFQREFGRTLLSDEENGVRSICESVECIPLRVVRAAHETREQHRSLIESASTDEKKLLAVLAVFNGTSVAAAHVAAVADVQNAEPILEQLEQRGLVQSHEQRYALAPDLKPEQLGDRQELFTQALKYFVNWTEQHRNDHKLITASGEAILLLLKQAVDARSWSEVRRLGHASEEALTVTGQWDRWANVLDSIELAAQAQGDVAERAWVLHQLGTRALALGDRYAAQTNLRDALGLRERLGDLSGAAVTRHNLDILLGPLPPEPKDDNLDVGAGRSSRRLRTGAVVLVGLVAIILLLVWRYSGSGETVTPLPIATPGVSPVTITTPQATPQTPEVSPPQVTPTQATPTATPKRVTPEPPKEEFGIDYFFPRSKEIRPHSKAELCYGLRGAVIAKISPEYGNVQNLNKDCVPVSPERTTVYTLTIISRRGERQNKKLTVTVNTRNILKKRDQEKL